MMATTRHCEMRCIFQNQCTSIAAYLTMCDTRLFCWVLCLEFVGPFFFQMPCLESMRPKMVSGFKVRALELSKFKSADGKAVLFGDMEPTDARQGAVVAPKLRIFFELISVKRLILHV